MIYNIFFRIRNTSEVSQTDEKAIQESKKGEHEIISHEKKDDACNKVVDTTSQQQSGTNNDSVCSDVSKPSDTVASLKSPEASVEGSTQVDSSKSNSTKSANRDSVQRRSKSPQTRRKSRSPIKPPTKQERCYGSRSPSDKSHRSPSLPSQQSRSSRPPKCDKPAPETQHSNNRRELGYKQNQSTNSNLPNSSDSNRKTPRSPSSSQRSDNREKSRSKRSSSSRSSQSRSSLSPRSQSRRSSSSRRTACKESPRKSTSKETPVKDRRSHRTFSSDKSRSPNKAVAIVQPRKRSPVE